MVSADHPNQYGTVYHAFSEILHCNCFLKCSLPIALDQQLLYMLSVCSRTKQISIPIDYPHRRPNSSLSSFNSFAVVIFIMQIRTAKVRNS